MLGRTLAFFELGFTFGAFVGPSQKINYKLIKSRLDAHARQYHAAVGRASVGRRTRVNTAHTTFGAL